MALPNARVEDVTLQAAWQELAAQAQEKPWLMKSLAGWRRGLHTAALTARFGLWKQRLGWLRPAEQRRLQRRLGVSLAGAALLLALSVGPAWGAPSATIAVTSGAAGIGLDAGCSLVEAIINANNNNQSGSTECTAGSGTDTITLPANSTLSYTTTFGSSSALPNVTSPIVLEANGSTIQRTGGGGFRIFYVSTATGILTINSATISGGSAGGSGGGVFVGNGGTVTLTNSTVSGNTTSSSGGGVYGASGTSVSVSSSTISNNSAGAGDGVFVRGPLTMNASTVSGNSASSGNGGGIYAGSAISVSVSGSTISSNSAAQLGGGMFSGATLAVTNSTLSGNSASGYGGGGGIYQGGGGSLTLTGSTLSGNSTTQGGGLRTSGSTTIINSTFSGNTASNRGGAIAHLNTTSRLLHSTLTGNSAGGNGGGGLFTSGTIVLAHSLISGNTASSNGNEVRLPYGTITANAYNLFGHGGESDAQAFSNFTPGANDIKATSNGTNATLASILNTTLASNGGSTKTHALLVGSPAVDAADETTCASTDQRGIGRPVDVNPSGPSGKTCDIGAFEIQSTTAVGLQEMRAAPAALSSLATLLAAGLTALGLGALLARRQRRRNQPSAPALAEAGTPPVADKALPHPGGAMQDRSSPRYTPPAITSRGRLKQFAGSPLVTDPLAPLDLP